MKTFIKKNKVFPSSIAQFLHYLFILSHIFNFGTCLPASRLLLTSLYKSLGFSSLFFILKRGLKR